MNSPNNDDMMTPLDPVFNDLEAHEEIPEDVEDFLAENGIKDVTYTCTCKKYPLGTGGTESWLPVHEKNSYPSREELGKRFGPGRYHLLFGWKARQTDKSYKRQMRELKITLGEEWNEIYDEYMAEKYITGKKKLKALKHRMEMENALDGNGSNERPRTTGIEEMINAKEQLKALGVPMGSENLPANNDNSMLQMMMNNNQQSAQFQMQMMMENNKNNMTLLTALIGQMGNGNQSNNPNKMMEMVMNMVTSTVDLKNALNPAQETAVDKVFKLMEGALPMIMALSEQKMSERKANPIYNMAVNSPEMQEMKANPAMQAEWIKKWDAKHGPDNTDEILSTVGMARPGQPVETEIEEVEEPTVVNTEIGQVNQNIIDEMERTPLEE